MHHRFRHLPIRRKLLVAFIATNAMALLVACIAFVAFEKITYRKSLARNLTVLADALGRNSTAALSFSNREDAEETLQALRFDPSVISGCLYSEAGEIFATYPPGMPVRAFPASPQNDFTTHFDGGTT